MFVAPRNVTDVKRRAVLRGLAVLVWKQIVYEGEGNNDAERPGNLAHRKSGDLPTSSAGGGKCNGCRVSTWSRRRRFVMLERRSDKDLKQRILRELKHGDA